MDTLDPLPQDHHEEVPRRVWNQIDAKINQERQKKKLFRMRLFTGIAACFILASILTYINFNIKSNNTELFASAKTYKSMKFEDLAVVDQADQLYDYKQVNNLKQLIIKERPDFSSRKY